MMPKLAVGDVNRLALAAEGDSQPLFLDHQLVVGRVADRQDVTWSEAKLFAALDQRIALGDRVEDRVPDLTAELAPGKDQAVGAHAVKADGPGDGLGEGQEAARHQQAARSTGAHGLDQGFRARSEPDALIEAALELALVEAREQAHPLAERTRKI